MYVTQQKILMIGLMFLITALGLSKVALPFFFETNQEHLVVMQEPFESEQKLLMAQTEASAQKNTWQVAWLAHELIPSAEAAESIPLAEEERGRNLGAAKVIELREKQKELNAREKALDERESEIQQAEKRAHEKIAALEQLESRIQAILTEEKSIKDKKIKRLTAVYEGMKADKAAPVIAQMELGIVIKIFSRMNEKQVGKILSFLPPKKAVVISQALTKRIASVR